MLNSSLLPKPDKAEGASPLMIPGPPGPQGEQGPEGPKGDPQTPSDATPLVDGTGAAGTATTYARGDHRHPTDTSRVPRNGDTGLSGDFSTTGSFSAGTDEDRCTMIAETGVSLRSSRGSVFVDVDGVVGAGTGEGSDAVFALPGGVQASNPANTMPLVVLSDDARLANARQPTAHASTHATGGSDPITPASIGAAAASSLATVATSGSYNDLTNKPTIPAAQVNADWSAASGVAAILNKPTIPTSETWTFVVDDGQGGTTTVTKSVAVYTGA